MLSIGGWCEILEFLRNATALKIVQQCSRYRGLEIRNTNENGWLSHLSLSGTDKWHSIKALHLVVCYEFVTMNASAPLYSQCDFD